MITTSYLKIKLSLGQYLQKVFGTAEEDEIVKVIKTAWLFHSAVRLLILWSLEGRSLHCSSAHTPNMCFLYSLLMLAWFCSCSQKNTHVGQKPWVSQSVLSDSFSVLSDSLKVCVQSTAPWRFLLWQSHELVEESSVPALQSKRLS